MFALAFPNIDPVAVELGPLAIRWYSLAYIAGLLLAWAYIRALVKHSPHAMTPVQVGDFLVWATLGVVLGGRLGHVLFYNFSYYLNHPLEILMVWQGGMSFHGGALGVILALILFCRQRHLSLLKVGDVVCCAVPIGLFFGRIANFVNGELYGRVTDVPWAIVFPYAGPDPRHPSQLYEAMLEGLVLFLLLYCLWRVETIRNRPGILSGVFLIGYGVARIVSELFRQPDIQLGYLVGGTTLGQWLSLPMVVIGTGLIVWAMRRDPA